MSFWDVIWFITVSFLFVAALMLIFMIIGDLFRDREMSGLGKGVWVLALVLVPFLASFIYLVARGRGMAERRAESMEAMRTEQESYIREVAGQSPVDQIARAQTLLDSGAISRQEFDALKARALEGAGAAASIPRQAASAQR